MRIMVCLPVVLLFFVFTASAQMEQTVKISSSPNPVGSGARALGMGGAFIGVADDATAASWNPAGLIQLETPEASIVGAYNFRREDTTYEDFPEASGPQDVSTYEINYLSAAYPFHAFGKNMIVSLNLQHLYDFNKEVNYRYTYQDLASPALILNNNVEYTREGDFNAISPALAVQITPYISFGLTINFWDHFLSDNKWEEKYRSQGTGTVGGFPLTNRTDIDETYTIDGLNLDLADPLHWHNANFHLGLLWELNRMLTLGVVFKAPFDAHLEHEYSWSEENVYTIGSAAISETRSEDAVLHMPKAYGFGFALRLSDALTVDLDVYRTEWSEYVLYDGDGNALNPITGKRQQDSDVSDTTQVRLGGEYLFIRDKYVIPVRGGVFYDPEPAEPNPDDFYGISLGTGIAYKKVIYDIAYQYRFGRNVRSTTIENEDSSQDVDQHTIYMSLIYHF